MSDLVKELDYHVSGFLSCAFMFSVEKDAVRASRLRAEALDWAVRLFRLLNREEDAEKVLSTSHRFFPDESSPKNLADLVRDLIVQMCDVCRAHELELLLNGVKRVLDALKECPVQDASVGLRERMERLRSELARKQIEFMDELSSQYGLPAAVMAAKELMVQVNEDVLEDIVSRVLRYFGYSYVQPGSVRQAVCHGAHINLIEVLNSLADSVDPDTDFSPFVQFCNFAFSRVLNNQSDSQMCVSDHPEVLLSDRSDSR